MHGNKIGVEMGSARPRLEETLPERIYLDISFT